MTQIKATVNLSSDKNNNVLQRLEQLEGLGDQIGNHWEALDKMGYQVSFSQNNGEVVIEVQPA